MNKHVAKVKVGPSKAIAAIKEPIHLSDYASQPDIRIFCTQAWTTPKWAGHGKRVGLPKGVYHADPDELYPFEDENVTCLDCKKKKLA